MYFTHHAVEMVTREDHDILHVLVLNVLEQPRILTHGIRSALKPFLSAEAWGLCSSKYLNKAVPAIHDAVAEVVRSGKVAVERDRIELSQDVHLRDSRVQAVRHRHVDKTIGTANGHSGLGTRLRKRVQSSACTTSKNHCSNRLGV